MHTAEQVPATPEENSRSKLDLSQVWSSARTAAAQSQVHEQQKAFVGMTGVSRQRHGDATADACPERSAVAPSPGSIMDRFQKLEKAMHMDVSNSRSIQPLDVIQVDACKGQPSRPAMSQACSFQQEQSGEPPPPPDSADVDVLRNAALTQHHSSREQANSQREHAQSAPKQQQSLPAQIAQNTQKIPELRPSAQQGLFRPVVQQQRVTSKHTADPREAMASPADAGPGRRIKLAEVWSMPVAPKPRKTPVNALPARQHAQQPARSHPAKVHSRLQQASEKASNVPCSRNGSGGTSVRGAWLCMTAVYSKSPACLVMLDWEGILPCRGKGSHHHSRVLYDAFSYHPELRVRKLLCAGEVDELNGLVTSLRAQCPVEDEPRHSGDASDTAAPSGDEQKPRKRPAGSFTQVALTVQALYTLSHMTGFRVAKDSSKAQLAESVFMQRPFTLLCSCTPPLRHTKMMQIVPADQYT